MSDATANKGDGAAVPASSPGFAGFVLRRPGFLAGYAIVGLMLLCGFLAPLLPLPSPVEADAAASLMPPGWGRPMGTDIAGLDIFSRTLHAPRIDLTIALAATLAAALLGGTLGAYAGLWEGARGLRGALSTLVLRLADVVQAFPVFALALVLVAVLGQGILSIVVAITVVSIPLYLRLMRAEMLTLRRNAYVEAARIAGAGDTYLLTRHLLPNAAAPLLAQMSASAGNAVLIAAGLSFIGAGVRAPTPEWGAMIASGFQNVVTGQWWPSIFPGLALSLTVFGLGRIGASILAFSSPRERARPTRRAWRAFVTGKLS
ncbi:hypothetical protein ACO34A_28805 (plasmid) [Rhizobium sp. ACO-34A]|nr:ABC transporter permease [Rhizobium sp. ACO-34A]ATN37765.1 hypothetical protein ACO34A_28805 [Rhizobium sp. ACO-34A]